MGSVGDGERIERLFKRETEREVEVESWGVEGVGEKSKKIKEEAEWMTTELTGAFDSLTDGLWLAH